jgi:hypothetical protein
MDRPDIRVPAGEPRPLTKSEKCSIAGRKGAATTNARYPSMKKVWGKKGFDALCEKHELTRAQGAKLLQLLNSPNTRQCRHSSRELMSLREWVMSLD